MTRASYPQPAQCWQQQSGAACTHLAAGAEQAGSLRGAESAMAMCRPMGRGPHPASLQQTPQNACSMARSRLRGAPGCIVWKTGVFKP